MIVKVQLRSPHDVYYTSCRNSRTGLRLNASMSKSRMTSRMWHRVPRKSFARKGKPSLVRLHLSILSSLLEDVIDNFIQKIHALR